MKPKKNDKGKARWRLLPLWVLESVVRVLENGAKKYGDFNWELVVSEDRDRYYDALLRHLSAWQRGDKADKDSGLPTMAHIVCCAIFLLWHDLKYKRVAK